jgi:hypothetical protein
MILKELNLFDRFYQNISYLLDLDFEFMEISCLKIFDFLQNVNKVIEARLQRFFGLKIIDLINFNLETKDYHQLVHT